jgi:predicted MPP superfamily phosphohydrolase
MRFLPLILAVVLVFGGAGVYAGLRIVSPLGLGWRTSCVAWVLLLLPATLPLWLIIDQLEVGKWLDLLLGLTYLALGFVSFLAVLALARDLSWLALRPGYRFVATSAELPDTARVLRISSIIVISLAILLSAVAIRKAFSFPVLKTVALKFENLHPDLQEFKIVQLSDLHVGLFQGAAFLAKIVEQVNGLSPDMVVITGDLADGSVRKLGHTVTPFADLEAPVFFVTGNHEYYWTPSEWTTHLEDQGVLVLLDSSRIITHQQARILAVGVTDPTNQIFFPHQPSGLSRATKVLDTTPIDFRVLLAHRAGTAYEAVGFDFDLQLSGHTHGGQFFPWNYIIHLVQPFAAGLYRYQDLWIYCSRGTGFWGPPMRLGSPAEITEIILKSEPSGVND